MRFRLLGPLEAENDEGLVEFGGIRQRAALAYLLLHSNQVVSTNQLLGALWVGGDAPTTARKILQNAIWRLRGAIAGPTSDSPAPRLLTRSPGYTVQVQAEQLDLLTFQQRVAAGRAALAGGDPQTARVLLSGALSLWRGPVLADLVEEGICWPEATALQNKRVDVMEDRFDAELACGGHQSILHDLKALVAAEPLRERASRQLMLALYRCGRQAEALSVYGRVREELVGGLGLEPSLELQRLQQSVLNQDPALDPPRAPQSLGLPASVTVLRPARERDGDGADVGPADPAGHNPAGPAGHNAGRAAGQTFGGPSGYTSGGAAEHTPATPRAAPGTPRAALGATPPAAPSPAAPPAPPLPGSPTISPTTPPVSYTTTLAPMTRLPVTRPPATPRRPRTPGAPPPRSPQAPAPPRPRPGRPARCWSASASGPSSAACPRRTWTGRSTPSPCWPARRSRPTAAPSPPPSAPSCSASSRTTGRRTPRPSGRPARPPPYATASPCPHPRRPPAPGRRGPVGVRSGVHRPRRPAP
ncbi:AfsR/SARP family transcriptional regulator [Streptomyces microflavus]|nr:AfsR/SARP family transcriptional regulator [Streptomyces microflavus]QQZ56071.1 AfsR/SARP family transcriptional regulator [Streptomyces microflavus]